MFGLNDRNGGMGKKGCCASSLNFGFNTNTGKMWHHRLTISLFVICFLSCRDKTLNEFDVVNQYINNNLNNTECIKSDCKDLFKWEFIKRIDNDSLHILIYAFKGENCDCLRVKREINFAHHTVIGFGVRKNTLKLMYLESGTVRWDLINY